MERHSGVGLLGLGWYLPPERRGNAFWGPDFAPFAPAARRADITAIERGADGAPTELAPEIAAAMGPAAADPFMGARVRHVLGDDALPSDMEAEAGRRALAAAGVAPADVDLVLVSSLVPDLLHPTNAPAVQAKCGLTNAAAWSLEVGCASFTSQLIAADALVRAGSFRTVLVVCSAATSRVTDYTTPVSVIFGDGAAAAVVGAVPAGYGVLGHHVRTDGSLRDGVVFAPVVQGVAQRRWEGSCAPIRVTSLDAEVGKLAGLRSTRLCREACRGALAAAGLTLADVALYVGTQSMGWFVEACRLSLGLAPDRVIDTFPEVANIGAAAIPYNLDAAARAGRLRDGDIVLMYAPGAGLTRSSVVYRWHDRGGA